MDTSDATTQDASSAGRRVTYCTLGGSWLPRCTLIGPVPGKYDTCAAVRNAFQARIRTHDARKLNSIALYHTCSMMEYILAVLLHCIGQTVSQTNNTWSPLLYPTVNIERFRNQMTRY